MLTQEQLKTLLSYDPETGVFVWINPASRRVKIGDIAGKVDYHKYVKIRVNYILYPAHRLAWLYIHGTFPENEIDHKNGVKSDNRISNLRPATRSENCMHRKILSSSKSKIKGVSWNKRDKKWIARCSVNGTRHLLGYFDNPEEASIIYQEFAKKNHGEFYLP